MPFKHNATASHTIDGVPYLWGSGDETTLPTYQIKLSQGVDYSSTSNRYGYAVSIGYNRVVVGAYRQTGAVYVYDNNGNKIIKLLRTGTTNNFNFFGHSVSVGSGKIVVGAYGDDAKGSQAGAAYVYDLNGNLIKKFFGGDTTAGDTFGYSVAAGSGIIVVGAKDEDDRGTNAGAVYIFDLNGNQLRKILASDGAANDQFGYSVAVGCGRIVVGSPNDDSRGSVYIFDLYGNQIAKVRPSDITTADIVGRSVAIGCGRIVVNNTADDDNGTDAGAAYIFDLNGNELKKIKATDGATSDSFGVSVAIGSGRIVVGADNKDDNGFDSGAAYIFDLNGNQLQKIIGGSVVAGDGFGTAVAVDTGKIVIGAAYDDEEATDSGSAYIYTTPIVYTPFDIAELNSQG